MPILIISEIISNGGHQRLRPARRAQIGYPHKGTPLVVVLAGTTEFERQLIREHTGEDCIVHHIGTAWV